MKQYGTIYTADKIPENKYTFSKKQKVFADAPPQLVNEVKKEVKKQAVKHALEETEKLSMLSNSSTTILFKCSSFFPFDFFPDEITIEPTQVNIRIKTFFLTSHLLTIPIKNITDIHVQTSLIFASIKIIDTSATDNTIELHWLKKQDAIRIRKIVQGLISAINEEIDVLKIDSKVLRKQSEILGNMHTITEW